MDTKRFIILMSALTALFSIIMVVYNFASQPPFVNTDVANQKSNTTSVNINNLFNSDISSSNSSSVLSSLQLQGSSQPSSKSPASSQKQVSSSVQKATTDNPVNINIATLDELESLPGIGAAKAQLILAYRTQNGNFTSIDQLDNIKGIGAITIEKLRPYITLK